MTKVNPNTKAAAAIIYDLYHHTDRTSIYHAYKKPSARKWSSFHAIEARACSTPGYNHDLHITGAGSHNYSTVYSFTEDGKTYAVKDTKANTYITEVLSI